MSQLEMVKLGGGEGEGYGWGKGSLVGMEGEWVEMVFLEGEGIRKRLD